MMKTRLMKKGRPRLVPQDDFQDASVNLWIDDKSDITSSDSSGESTEDSDVTEASSFTDNYRDHHDEDEDSDDLDDDDLDDDDDIDDDLTMEHTIDQVPTNQSEKTEVQSEITPLFQAIENKEWDGVVVFLESGSWGWKLSSLCAQLYQVSEKSASAQARTWISATKKDDKNKTCQLPIHAAMAREAPYRVIQALIQVYPKAVTCPDSDGNYPLHLAFANAAGIDTMTLLMKEFPEAIHLQNEVGQVPPECGNARGVASLLQLCINATKTHVESDLTKEKGNLEEDRKQLLEVTKELMNLKKIVAERERNMTKENFVHQKQHLTRAISQLTKLKTDLDQHEENVLKHHIVAERKRMDGVLGELKKTKGELEMIRSEKHMNSEVAAAAAVKLNLQMPASPHQQKKKRTRKTKKSSTKTEQHATNPDGATMQRDDAPTSEATPRAKDAPAEWSLAQDDSDLAGVGSDQYDQVDDHGILVETDSGYERNGAQSPKKLKNVAMRFKKKMSWRKMEKQPFHEAE